MPSKRFAIRFIPFALALAGSLAACGGGGGAKQPTVGVEDQAGFSSESLAVRQARVENLVRYCMQAQGFKYVPVDPDAARDALLGVKGMSEDDYVKQFGDGITTLYEQRLKNAVPGPNAAIVAALAPAERTAYDRALFGDDPTATFALAVDTGDFTRLGGCVKESTDTVFGGAAFVENLIAKLDELDERIVADRRMVDAIANWSACMRQAGFDLQNPDQVDTVLQSKLEDIVGPPEGRVADYDKEALVALQREEVAMVGADIACEDKHITAIEDKVRSEYEREFRQNNAGLLEKVPKA